MGSTGELGSPAVSRQLVGQLARVGLLEGLSRAELDAFARAAKTERVPAGQVLCDEGAPGHEFFLIGEGRAVVEQKGRRVTELGPGDSFGELALLDRGPRSATVRAETDMALFVVDELDFSALLDEVPALARKLLANLAARLRRAEARPLD
jgi:CRP/FNR family transcriptional regulator, cyclic AMP receptor protein